MSSQVKEEMLERGLVILEVFGVVVVYFGIVALLMYPVLHLGGYLS